jgi:hypothetical protein
MNPLSGTWVVFFSIVSFEKQIFLKIEIFSLSVFMLLCLYFHTFLCGGWYSGLSPGPRTHQVSALPLIPCSCTPTRPPFPFKNFFWKVNVYLNKSKWLAALEILVNNELQWEKFESFDHGFRISCKNSLTHYAEQTKGKNIHATTAWNAQTLSIIKPNSIWVPLWT